MAGHVTQLVQWQCMRRKGCLGLVGQTNKAKSAGPPGPTGCEGSLTGVISSDEQIICKGTDTQVPSSFQYWCLRCLDPYCLVFLVESRTPALTSPGRVPRLPGPPLPRLQARHVLCLQARHLLCLQPRHLLRQQTEICSLPRYPLFIAHTGAAAKRPPLCPQCPGDVLADCRSLVC